MSRSFRSGELPDVVVRADDEAGPLALEELANRLDLLGRGHLLGDHVIETEDEQRVRVGEDPLVEREARSPPGRRAGTWGPRAP